MTNRPQPGNEKPQFLCSLNQMNFYPQTPWVIPCFFPHEEDAKRILSSPDHAISLNLYATGPNSCLIQCHAELGPSLPGLVTSVGYKRDSAIQSMKSVYDDHACITRASGNRPDESNRHTARVLQHNIKSIKACGELPSIITSPRLILPVPDQGENKEEAHRNYFKAVPKNTEILEERLGGRVAEEILKTVKEPDIIQVLGIHVGRSPVLYDVYTVTSCKINYLTRVQDYGFAGKTVNALYEAFIQNAPGQPGIKQMMTQNTKDWKDPQSGLLNLPARTLNIYHDVNDYLPFMN